MRRRLLILALLLACQAASLSKAESEPDLFDLPIEELLKVNVGVLNRSGERLLDSSASISVLSADDIRRSRATTIPEVLRLVPGLSVGRLYGGIYSVGVRGDQGRFADKILVLMDGRPVYTPEFGGVPWEVYDMYLPDIDHIEVIRGPGASLWGANAINGIISIITKRSNSSSKSQGYVAGGNTFRRGIGGSYEGGFGNRTVRFSLNHQQLSNDRIGAENTGQDSQGQASFNVRMDSENERLRWSTQLRANVSSLDNIGVRASFAAPVLAPSTLGYPSSENFPQLAVLREATNRQFLLSFQQSVETREKGDSQWRVLYGLSRQLFEDLLSGTISMNVLDIDGYASRRLGNHQVLYGLTTKVLNDDWNNDSPALQMLNASTTKSIVTGFLQDTVSAFSGALSLTGGGKVQYNDYTGFEYEPSIRATSKLSDNCVLWGAWSRAVKIPNRSGKCLSNFASIVPAAPGSWPLPIDFRVTGDNNSNPVTQVLFTRELGIRGEHGWAGRSLGWDVSFFRNSYNRLFDVKAGQFANAPEFVAQPVPHLIGYLTSADFYQYQLKNWGTEAQLTAQLARNIRLIGWYSGLFSKTNGAPISGGAVNYSRPKHQSMIRLTSAPTATTELDVTLRTSTDSGVLFADNRSLDIRLAYIPIGPVKYELLGLDLLHGNHVEARTQPSYNLRPVGLIQRTVVGRVSFQW